MLKRLVLLSFLSLFFLTACSTNLNGNHSEEKFNENQNSFEGFIYLFPNTENANLFLFNQHTNQSEQLTNLSREIYDYEVSSDGNNIFYSVLNSNGGTEIRKINLNSLADEKLFDCGFDFCFNPVYSNKNETLLINKINSSIFTGIENELTELWKYDLKTADFKSFSGLGEFYGVFPKWNDQETYVAVQILNPKRIMVFNPLGETLAELETNFQIGVYDWSSAGKALYFLNEEINDDKPVNFLWKYSFLESTFEQQEIEGKVDEFLITNISFSPTGTQWIAGIKESVFLPSQVLWIMNEKDNSVESVIGDNSKIYSNFEWNKSGDQILFQKYQLESTQSATSVVVWDLDSEKETVVLNDAWLPRWLP